MAIELGEEPAEIEAFRAWFCENGGFIHPLVQYQRVDSGFSIIAKDTIENDTEIISCPFSLVITPELSRKVLKSVCRMVEDREDPFREWTEQQLMCTYICLHWILMNSEHECDLQHRPYIKTLPASSQLFTSIHFTPTEISLFKGTNLHSATFDRKVLWQQNHTQCQAFISFVDPSWGAALTWERYLTAATYISSRAFPSTLLGQVSSLVATPDSYPVLLPGVDALNHARAKPVSWLVSQPPDASTVSSEASSKISLVLHTSTPASSELFNNYGPKPNAELLLGYGFTLKSNPDDTIVLKIGGSASHSCQDRWEVGRGARGIEPVWLAVLDAVHEEEEEEAHVEEGVVDVEEELYAAEVLGGMAHNLLDKLPPTDVAISEDVRAEVVTMLSHYVEGQRDILQSIIQFAQEKEQRALRMAEEQGLDRVEEKGDDENK